MSAKLYTQFTSHSATPAELVVASPVVGWIFAVAGIVSLACVPLLLPQVLARPTPAGMAIMVACALYALLCAWCWRERRHNRRAVLTVGLFAWSTITFIGAAALPQRSGVNTVGFMVMPAFLFMITVLGQRRLSLATLAWAAMVFGGVALHHGWRDPAALSQGSTLANLLIAAALMLTFAALGDQIARVVAEQVHRARRTAQDYRVLFERLPVGALLHVNRRIIDSNEAAQRLMAAESGLALVGLDLLTLVPESEKSTVLERLRQMQGLSPGKHLPMRELSMRALDGSPVAVAVTAVALDPVQGVVLVLMVDQREPQRARHELQQSQRLVQALFSASAHTMAVTDRDTGEFLLVNPAYARMANREPQEMIGRSTIDLGLITAEQRKSLLDARGPDGSATTIHLTMTDSAGVPHEVRQSVVTTEIDGRSVLVAVGRDVTEEIRRERELRAILESAPAAIYVVRHGLVTAASSHYERLLGLAPGTGVGRPYHLDLGGPDSRDRLARRWRDKLAEGGIVRFEHEVFRADGSTFPGRFTGRLIKPGAQDGFGMVWVIEDMTERREREAQLARAKSDAEAASRAKTGFLATMSHEIRTPLNGILGLIELVREPHLDPATRQSYLEMMVESAHALQEIVSDVIDVSRIESGRLSLELRPFDLGPWLESVRLSFSALAEAKNLVLEVQADPQDLGSVRGDPTRLRQILANYLSNALKFTLKGRITVRVARLRRPDEPGASSRVRLEVQDSGIGIPADVLPALFQPYAQALAAARDGQVRSSGLGLSICRQLAELMGGRAGVHSEHGVGSCFWVEVELPLVGAGASALSRTGGAAEEPPLLQGLRLLVVDDNRINLVVARRLLERARARVDIVDGGQAALSAVDDAQAQGDPYDLVVMDVQMPGMDGLQALAALRQRSHGAMLPVLAASAAVTTEEVDLTRAAGFCGFVSKPLEAATLVKAIREALVRPTVRF